MYLSPVFSYQFYSEFSHAENDTGFLSITLRFLRNLITVSYAGYMYYVYDFFICSPLVISTTTKKFKNIKFNINFRISVTVYNNLL